MAGRTLRNATDTWVDQFVPSKTHSDDKRLGLRASGSGLTKRAFIYFNRPFPRGATVVAATLRLYGRGTGWGSRTVWVERTDGTGPGYARTNWNNQPGVEGSVIPRTQTNPADGTEWAWDVTPHMQTVSNGAGWFGWRLTIDDDNRYNFYSSDALNFKPTLEVEWADAPEAPTTLTPDGGVVGVSHPVLRWDFTDYGGDDSMDGLQVQVDAGNDFASPDFDSGELVSTEPELNLGATAYAGLSNGATTWWRVRVQDGAGLWSDWSDPASMTRQDKASLAITNPAADPNDFVTEWTPPISWTFSGTQTAWRVIVEKVNDLGANVTVADSGYTAGTETSWTVPRGALTEDGATYKVIVRVHDQYDREHSPGDLAFINATREFTYQPGGTTGITGLDAATLVDTPFVELTWTRASAPDSFTVKRNGRVVETDLDPDDLLVSGTSYRYVDRTAPPNKEHTWKVAANVNGIHSVDSDVTRAISDVTGMYLWDPDLSLLVLIKGVDVGTWEMGENAETHYPINAQHGVRITQALRGWESTISGHLYDGNVSADVYADRMMRIKERPGRILHFLATDIAFRGVVHSINVSPAADPSAEPRDKDVSFTIIQTRDFTFDPRL